VQYRIEFVVPTTFYAYVEADSESAARQAVAEPIDTLRRLHAALVAPYEWHSGTIETVAEILAEAGVSTPITASSPPRDVTESEGLADYTNQVYG
jgi:hypothetical protein